MRFGDLIRSSVLLCGLLILGCSDTGPGTVGTGINLDIIYPSNGVDGGAYTVDRVDYTVTCVGTQLTAPLPGPLYPYDDSAEISGSFQIVDGQFPPVWETSLELPPGDCTMTLSVFDGDEIICIGTETLLITAGVTSQFNIVLLCTLSVDTPDGQLRVDGNFVVVTGNLCPMLHSVMAIPSVVDINAIPPRTRVEYRSVDPNGTCGANCQPETCTDDAPPVCSPSVFNPADPRCNPDFGGDPLAPECQDGTASGLVCILTATPTATALPGGSFVSPYDGTTLIGPSVAINLEDYAGDGTGTIVPGVDIFYECDPTIPGSVIMDVDCGDGDPLCNRFEAITVICPGQNFCDSNPIDCSAPSDCTADGLCDAFCDPADTCDRCPGQGDPLPSGTACASGGGSVCDGAGACVECVDDSQCDSSLLDCREPAQCIGNVCQPRNNSAPGTPCSNGECDSDGVCQFVAIDPPAVMQSLTVGCVDSVTSDVTITPFELTVDPTAIVSGTAWTASLDGVALFAEEIVDQVEMTVPGGVTQIEVLDLQATVHLRAGGTGADVTLLTESVPFTCEGDGTPCDPINDVGGTRENTDCLPQSVDNACGRFVDVPVSGDCAPGGVCDGLGKMDSQCAANGFCATGPVPLPLQAATGSYTADPAGTVLFGWDDASTGATVDVDGTWILPPAVFGDPTGPNGLRLDAGGLSIAVECTMGVDSADPVDGVGVPDKSSPSPDAVLITYPIQVP